MDLLHIFILVIGGLVGGVISSLVGGAALVTYPALLSVGLPPVVATVCNLVALTPGNFLAALYDRTQLPPIDRSFAGLIAASLIGAFLGAGLLLVTPERLFAYFIPLLMAFATVLFALAGRISAFMRRRAGGADTHRWAHSISVILPVSFYGGYFGAGVGVLLAAVLSIGTAGNYRAANVTKNLVTSLNSLIAGDGALDADPADDVGRADRRFCRRAPRAGRAEPHHARGRHARRRAAHRRFRLALLALAARHQLREPPHQLAVRVGQGGDDGEVIGARHGLAVCRHASLAPGIGEEAALAQELSGLRAADHGVEDPALRRGP